MSDGNELSKVDRLAIASAVAPVLRSVTERVSRRRVKVYSRATGETLREATMGEALRGLAEAYAIEHTIDDAEARRTKKETKVVECLVCTRPFEVETGVALKKGYRGSVCAKCVVAPCAGGCGKITPSHATLPGIVRARKCAPWTCGTCAQKKRFQDPVAADRHRAIMQSPEYIAKMREVTNSVEHREKMRALSSTPERKEAAARRGRELAGAPGEHERRIENGRKGAAVRWKKDVQNGR